VRVHVGDIFDLGLWTLDDQAAEEIGRREDAVRGRHGAGDGQARTANGHPGRKTTASTTSSTAPPRVAR
jgi:hypothetical protein